MSAQDIKRRQSETLEIDSNNSLKVYSAPKAFMVSNSQVSQETYDNKKFEQPDGQKNFIKLKDSPKKTVKKFEYVFPSNIDVELKENKEKFENTKPNFFEEMDNDSISDINSEYGREDLFLTKIKVINLYRKIFNF